MAFPQDPQGISWNGTLSCPSAGCSRNALSHQESVSVTWVSTVTLPHGLLVPSHRPPPSSSAVQPLWEVSHMHQVVRTLTSRPQSHGEGQQSFGSGCIVVRTTSVTHIATPGLPGPFILPLGHRCHLVPCSKGCDIASIPDAMITICPAAPHRPPRTPASLQLENTASFWGSSQQPPLAPRPPHPYLVTGNTPQKFPGSPQLCSRRVSGGRNRLPPPVPSGFRSADPNSAGIQATCRLGRDSLALWPLHNIKAYQTEVGVEAIPFTTQCEELHAMRLSDGHTC